MRVYAVRYGLGKLLISVSKYIRSTQMTDGLTGQTASTYTMWETKGQSVGGDNVSVEGSRAQSLGRVLCWQHASFLDGRYFSRQSAGGTGPLRRPGGPGGIRVSVGNRYIGKDSTKVEKPKSNPECLSLCQFHRRKTGVSGHLSLSLFFFFFLAN